MSKTPTTLIIMDGFGLREDKTGNAIAAANKPNLDKIFAENPGCRLSASGLDVGLPEGQMGNSEVGHTNIGAGRVVFQDLPRISRAIEDGSFFENEAYIEAMDDCKERDGALHVFGLLSDGGVHSHITHIFALLEMAKRRGLSRVFVHCFLDGRDVPPASGKGYVEQLAAKCAQLGVGRIATVMGRYYAMDRDKRWDRLQRAYDAIVLGVGAENADPVDAVQKSYDAGVTDEFVEPVVCTKDGKVREGDSIIFMNFRPDRAREITRCFVDPAFTDVERKHGCFPVTYVCTTEYDATMPNVLIAFPHRELVNIFGEYNLPAGLHPAAHRRDREVRPRDLLLQRRRGAGVRGGGPLPDPLPQGGHLRPPAGDERPRGHRGGGAPHRERQVRRDHPQLRQLRHGGPHRRV